MTPDACEARPRNVTLPARIGDDGFVTGAISHLGGLDNVVPGRLEKFGGPGCGADPLPFVPNRPSFSRFPPEQRVVGMHRDLRQCSFSTRQRSKKHPPLTVASDLNREHADGHAGVFRRSALKLFWSRRRSFSSAFIGLLDAWRRCTCVPTLCECPRYFMMVAADAAMLDRGNACVRRTRSCRHRSRRGNWRGKSAAPCGPAVPISRRST